MGRLRKRFGMGNQRWWYLIVISYQLPSLLWSRPVQNSVYQVRSSLPFCGCQPDRVAFCDPTSTPKLPRLLTALSPSRPITHLSPNLLELDLLHSLLPTLSDEIQSEAWDRINSYNLLADFRAKLETWTAKSKGRGWIAEQGVIQKAVGLLPFVEDLWIKCGSLGVVRVHLTSSEGGGGDLRHALPDGRVLRVRHFTPLQIKEDEIVSTTGAGDTLVGSLVAGLLSGDKEEDWVGRALERVKRTMMSHRAVG
jgi:pseudouridine-5'-phosphate glycosidase/pseudouridine kinase